MAQQTQNRLHYLALICGIGGLLWLIVAYGWQRDQALLPTAMEQAELRAGTVATMDSPPFTYSPGWTVGASGADTQEPADPWQEPSGVVTFQYQGQALALQLAVGNYWGYLYVTVDGEPANLLTDIRNNHNSQQEAAGYRTFYAPEKQGADGLSLAQWVPVHKAPADGVYDVRVDIWRSWGQVPLRGVAVDALPGSSQPLWPGVALLIAAIWLWFFSSRGSQLDFSEKTQLSASPIHYADALAIIAAICAVLLLIVGILNEQWMFSLAGYVLLACAALWQPALWMAAVLFSLPFYYEYSLPLLPSRAFNLIEMGILGGIAVVMGREIWARIFSKVEAKFLRQNFVSSSPMIWLWALISWALISALAAEHVDLALREWRTVFLASGVLALLLAYTLRPDPTPIDSTPIFQEKARFLIGAWLFGGAVIGVVALWQYMSGTSLITAEDVSRVRAFYGSPNNLALYLERTVMVGAALALFSRSWHQKLFWATLTLPQAAALLLTYSRGAILLGIPAGVLVLILGGWLLYRGSEFSFQLSALKRYGFGLLILVILAGVAAMILIPLVGTARLQQAFDFSQGTGFLRFQMWRSAWQMALDHPLLGVGPDNFLYAFRSQYILPAAWQEPNLNHPHNWLLDFWTRLGLPGLIFGLFFMTSGIWNLWQGVHRKGTALALGLLAAVFTALAHGMIDASYALPDLMMVWVLLYCIDD